MSLFANMTGNKALKAHSNGEYDKALELYAQAYEKGCNTFRVLRSYVVLLIRTNQYDKAIELLKKLEKTPGISAKDKMDIHVNYAIILSQKGRLDRALEILFDEFKHTKNGNLYSIIGFLLIEKGDAQEALAFNQDSLEYDESDAVFLDNMGQTYYRLLGDKEQAKPYFEKAIAIKPSAIDTNYFLALYAIDEGDMKKAKEHLEKALEGFSSPLNYASPERIRAKLAEIE